MEIGQNIPRSRRFNTYKNFQYMTFIMSLIGENAVRKKNGRCEIKPCSTENSLMKIDKSKNHLKLFWMNLNNLHTYTFSPFVSDFSHYPNPPYSVESLFTWSLHCFASHGKLFDGLSLSYARS